MFDPIYIPVVAFCGSACGSIATILSNWVAQRRQDRVRNKSRASSRRAKLYKAFIEEASKLYADALVNDKSEASKLVGMYALIARMKVMSSDGVIEAAEKAGHLIIETYLAPNRTFADLADLIKEMDPLRDFSEACRHELQNGSLALISVETCCRGCRSILPYGFQPASQAARKKPTRSRMKDGSSFRKIFASSPMRDRISIGSRMRSMKIWAVAILLLPPKGPLGVRESV